MFQCITDNVALLPGLAESVVQDMHEIDRPDSPDFLTADEDDRTTAVASDLQDDQAESVEGSGGSSNNSTTSQGSHLSTVVEVSQEKAQTPPQAESGKKMPMPEPPTDTKPFMEVPAEALRANLAYAVQQSSGNKNTEEGEQSSSKDDTTWSLSAQAAQSVVCEQPSSTQVSHLHESFLVGILRRARLVEERSRDQY